MEISQQDHDLLVRLDTKLDALSIQFAEVRLTVATKTDNARTDKLETQIDHIKNKLYMAAGGLVTLQIVLQYAVPKLLK